MNHEDRAEFDRMFHAFIKRITYSYAEMESIAPELFWAFLEDEETCKWLEGFTRGKE